MKNKFAIGAYFLKILSCVYCGTCVCLCVSAGQLKPCNNIAQHEPAHTHTLTHTDLTGDIHRQQTAYCQRLPAKGRGRAMQSGSP